ncbi:MAG: hypothetical protein LBS25_08555 [Candidatus Symbiothrix sp.]|jgi:hypothetical protein|nr:hypothetical protein [Candidatus Symbiothrix sp.]
MENVSSSLSKIELKFTAPKILESLTSATGTNKVQWTYGGKEESPLYLNVNDWQIFSDTDKKTAHITKWLVNQDNNAMLLAENADSSYQEIDFAFAMSMLGQTVQQRDLPTYFLYVTKGTQKIKFL